MQKQPYILWLPTWYPNKLAPYEGDFIQRHAHAAALFRNIVVLALVHDKAGNITKKTTTETTRNGNLTQITVYYHSVAPAPKRLSRPRSFLMRIFLYRKMLKNIFNEMGLPGLVHVQVAGWAALPALWLRNRYRLPLLLSEHWGGYLHRGNAGYNHGRFTQRWLIQKTYKKAVGISAPSHSLARNLNALFGPLQCRVIPNVVDTSLFKPAHKKSNGILRLIHISTLDHPKNVEAMIGGLGMFYRDTGYRFCPYYCWPA